MNWKKWTAMTMTSVMAVSLAAGCSKTENASGTNESPQGTGAKTESNVNVAGLPIVKQPIELTFFTGLADTNGSTPFEERLVWSEYAKQSNVKVNFQTVPFTSLTEKRNLALANGDYPDAFYSARVPASDLMKYGGQGVFVKLNDYINQYAPNLKKLMDKYPDLRKALTMPDGNIYSFPSFYSPEFLPMLIGTPLWVKQDWLAKLNMKEPQTTEDLYNYLKAVKSTDLNGNGQADEIPYSGIGIGPLIDQIKGAWGIGTRGLGHKFVDIDPKTNELRFFRLTQNNKELLQYVSKLYGEGLIDKDVFTQNTNTVFAKGAKNVLGATINPNPKTQFNGDGYAGLGALKGPNGDQLYTNIKVPMVWPGAFVLTNKNKNIEATIRWMDYFFSDEGARFYFMGMEGKSYKKLADGSLDFVDELKNNPSGLTLDQSLQKFVTWMGGSYPGYVQAKYFKGSETLPESMEAGKKAQPNAIKELWYNFNFTDSETEYMSSKGAEIQKYIDEMEAKFITGATPFSEWDKYVTTVKGMGVDQYLKTYKAAYDRYNSSK